MNKYEKKLTRLAVKKVEDDIMESVRTALRVYIEDDLLVSEEELANIDPLILRDEKMGICIATSVETRGGVIITQHRPLKNFLDDSEGCYGCGDAGWGQDMIDDYKQVILALQERIDKMEKSIQNERK